MVRSAAIASVVGVTVVATVAAGGFFMTRGAYSAANCPRFTSASADLTRANSVVPASATVGQLLVAHDRSGDASVVDLATGRVTFMDVGLTEPHEVAISSDGRWGVMSDFGAQRNGLFQGNRLAVIDMVARRHARTIDLGANRGAHGVTFIPGTTRALVTTQTSRTIVEVDVRTGAILGTFDTRADGSHLLTLSPDGRSVYSVNEGNGSVTRLDVATRAFVWQRVLGPAPSEGLAITPDGRELWVGTDVSGRVRILDAESGAVRDSISGFANPVRIAISRDGRRAVVADRGCSHVVDVPTRRVVGDILGYTGSFGTSGDGRIAFMEARADGVALVDVETGRVVATHKLRHWAHGIAWGPAPDN
jgi:DNA-binding beta-propeller fold protein YncE